MRFKVNFFSIMLFLSLLFSEGWRIFFIILPAVLHELGHLAAAYVRGVTVREMNVTIMGARITLGGCYSYTDEFIISLCGPLVNVISVYIANICIRYFTDTTILYDFYNASLSLAITNLLPIKSFDGGRMIHCILSNIFNSRLVNSIISTTSFIVLFSIWCVSVYFLLRLNSSLSVFVFSISMFANIFITKSI